MNTITSINRDKYIQELGNLKSLDTQAIVAKIANSELSVMPSGIYSARNATGKTVLRMFESFDVKSLGITSLAEGRPEKNALHLVKGIRVTAITLGAAPTDVTIRGANFVDIGGIAGAQNGLITIKSNRRTLIHEMPLSQFANLPADRERGVVWLNNPKWVIPDQPLEVEFEFPVTLPDNTVVKVELITEATSV